MWAKHVDFLVRLREQTLHEWWCSVLTPSDSPQLTAWPLHETKICFVCGVVVDFGVVDVFRSVFCQTFFVEQEPRTHMFTTPKVRSEARTRVARRRATLAAALPRRARAARVLRRCSSADPLRSAAATPAWLGIGKGP